MSRPKKDYNCISLKLAKDISERLDKFVDDSGLSKTRAIEKALVAFMDDYYRKEELINQLEK